MRPTVPLRNVIGEAQHLFVETAVPLHCHLDANIRALVALAVTDGMEGVGMQNRLAGVDELNKTTHAASAGKIIGLTCALIFQLNSNPVVQEAEFA